MSADLISYLSKFTHLSEDVILDINKMIKTFSFPKKTLLLKPGQVCNYLYFIKKGLARNYMIVDDKELTTDIIIDGELLTSFSSFIKQQPSNEYIELIEDCQLNAISYNDLQTLYNKHKEMERIGRRIAEYHFNSLTEHTYMLRYKSTSERYEYLATKKIEIIKRTPLGVIASYLGMTNENLSRIRKKQEN